MINLRERKEINMNTSTAVVTIVLMVAVIIGLGFLFAFPVMWLWNWLCPDLFDLPVIGFWQAWGLSTLCGLLFKSHNTNTKKE